MTVSVQDFRRAAQLPGAIVGEEVFDRYTVFFGSKVAA